MPNELTIDLSNHPIPFDFYKKEASAFLALFKLSGAPAFTDFVYEQVKLADITTLISNMDATGRADDSFLKGMRLHYGVVNGEVRLLFQPVFIDQASAGSVEYNINNRREAPSSADTYLYSGGFNRLNPTDADACCAKYQSDIRIKHDGITERNFNVFDPVNPWIADVKSVVFPCKEIIQVAADNNVPDNNFLYFTSATRIDYNSYSYKHIVVISPVDPASLPVAPFKGKAANLANMCPPHCASIFIIGGNIVA